MYASLDIVGNIVVNPVGDIMETTRMRRITIIIRKQIPYIILVTIHRVLVRMEFIGQCAVQRNLVSMNVLEIENR